MTTSDGRPGGRQVIAWALYDWANSAFATTVLAGFFPLFFKKYWSAGSDVTVSTFQLGVANAAASLAVAVLAPVLGASADRSGWRRTPRDPTRRTRRSPRAPATSRSRVAGT